MASPTAISPLKASSNHPIEMDSLWCNNNAQAKMDLQPGDHAFVVVGCFPCEENKFSSCAIHEVIIVGRCCKYGYCQGFACYYVSTNNNPKPSHTCGKNLTDTLSNAQDRVQTINYQSLEKHVRRKLKIEETIRNVENICLNPSAVDVTYDGYQETEDDEGYDGP